MPVKIQAPGSQVLDREPIYAIKRSSRGLRGVDFADFVKRAGLSLADRVRRMEHKPGERLTHNIALGCTEKTGSNRNGDGFPAEACRKYHHTFVKNARVYRDHCFPAGTLVTRGDRVRVPIEEIRVGDAVVTTDGIKPVSRTMCDPYSGSGVRLRYSGVPGPMTVTDEHPVLVLRRETVHCRHNYSRLAETPHGLKCVEWRNGLRDLAPEYIPANQIRKDDYVLIPKPEHGRRIVEPAFARLVGWIASEGCLGKRGSIQFTFSSNNVADIESVRTCLKENGLYSGVHVVEKTGCTMISACSAEMCAELGKYVIGKKSEKRLTAAVMDWDEASLYEFLATYVEGDGHVPSQGVHKGQLRVRSASFGMLQSLSDVIRALGIPATVQHDKAESIMVSPTNGKEYLSSAGGVVAVNSAYSYAIVGKTRKAANRESRRLGPQLQLNGLYLSRVLSVTPVLLNELVYNLEVPGPNNYVANEVVVHNCNKDPSRSYGVIHLSDFNEPMGRIELITGLNETKEAADRNGGLVADKEIAKLDAGKTIPTSMACRVPEDYCSSCGNPARHRSEYCDESTCDRGGLKNNLGKVAADGHVMHAVNKDPNWFDESSVWRGADRIAYVLGEYEKAAAAGTIKSGAELAEELGLTDPLPSVSSFTRAVPLLKLAVALADLERTFDASSSGLDGAFAPELRTPLDLSPFAKTAADRAALVSALTEQKICLPLSDFLTLHYGQPPEKVAHLAASAAPHLRGAFGRLVDDPNLEQRCMDSAYSSSAAASDRARIYATKLASLYSWDDSSRRQRAVLASLRGVSIPKVAVEKTASHDPAAERLAEEYALYKLAFLAGCGSVVETSPLLTLAVRQNYFNNPLA